MVVWELRWPELEAVSHLTPTTKSRERWIHAYTLKASSLSLCLYYTVWNPNPGGEFRLGLPRSINIVETPSADESIGNLV